MRIRIVLVIFVALLIVIGLGIWFMTAGSLSVSTGRALIADNGSVLLIADNSPIVLSNRGGEKMFDGISTGDEIAVFHDGVRESYPAQTGAYFVIRKGGGSIEDIPAQVLDSLRELGWIG